MKASPATLWRAIIPLTPLKMLPTQIAILSSFLFLKPLSCRFTELPRKVKHVLSERFGWRLKVHFRFH